MFLSEDLIQAIKTLNGNLVTIKPVSGGSINQSYQITTNTGRYFLKTNTAEPFPDLFLCEAEGLSQIRRTNTLAVPDVIAHGKAGGEIFLILNWIDTGASSSYNQHLFGIQLARMHAHIAERFGSEHNNYIGSLPQTNRWHTTWHEFFTIERLQPQIQISYDKRLISRSIKNSFEILLTKLQSLYPPEKACLVHGDLWAGNYIIDSTGTPMLIDPAVYYGNRETDIAMTMLFGGFSTDFYKGYQDEFPLQAGWQERLDIWNLYPLLVHLNLFRAGYLPQIESSLKRFS